jgi:hypothetical protein
MPKVSISNFARLYGPHHDEYIEKIYRINKTKPKKLDVEPFQNLKNLDFTDEDYVDYPLNFNKISYSVPDKLDGYARSSYFQRGNLVESTIIRKLKKKKYTVFNIQACKNQIINGVDLIAKIDGIIELGGEKVLLEIKSRIGKNTDIMIYDMVQCQIYMEMFGLDKCLIIVEHCGQIYPKLINKDNAMIKQLLNTFHILSCVLVGVE